MISKRQGPTTSKPWEPYAVGDNLVVTITAPRWRDGFWRRVRWILKHRAWGVRQGRFTVTSQQATFLNLADAMGNTQDQEFAARWLHRNRHREQAP